MLAQCPPCSVEMACATRFYMECVCNTRCVSRRYHMPITTHHNRVTESPIVHTAPLASAAPDYLPSNAAAWAVSRRVLSAEAWRLTGAYRLGTWKPWSHWHQRSRDRLCSPPVHTCASRPHRVRRSAPPATPACNGKGPSACDWNARRPHLPASSGSQTSYQRNALRIRTHLIHEHVHMQLDVS